jgi:hypothetical protein
LCLLEFGCALGGFGFILELEAAFDLGGYIFALGPGGCGCGTAMENHQITSLS